ncbi:MAG: hypothetical protein FWD05_13520, partial [Oscillospiraceae bacterium]|nr:hypothetical protein [Oscillospiraceae bacterium]
MMRVKQRNVAKPKRRVIAIITVIMMVISIVSLTILAVAEDVYYVPVVEAADEYTPHEPSLSDTESNTASDSDSEHDSEQEDNESDSSDSGENTDNDVDIVLTCDISDNQSDDSYYAHDTCESGDKHQYDNEEYEEALCTCECKGYCDYDCTCECEDCYVEIEALVDFVVTDWNGLHEVFTNLMTTDGPYTVDVAGSITMNSQLNIPVGRTVNLTGGVLYQPTANARHFTVEGTLILNGITLRGTGTATYRGGIMVNGGELIMSAGSVIEGNRAIFGGGVHNNGIFTMTGGTISYNLVWDGNWGGDGGGVYNTGTFAMTDGEIFRNQSEDGGGGISSRGTFILSGGTIRNNGANGGSGVDILNGEFVMTAGSIINNGGWFGPGGVLVRSGTFTMHGGEVSRN